MMESVNRKTKTYISLLGIITQMAIVCVFAAPVPLATEYQHWRTRQAIMDSIITSSSSAHWEVSDEFLTSLSKEEVVVGRYLDYLRGGDLSTDILTRGVEKSLPDIFQSQLFLVLRRLPKGGNMHAHENHLLSRRVLLDLIWERPEFEHLYILPDDHPSRPLHMDLFLEPPGDEPWIQVKGDPVHSKDYLLQRLNHVDLLNRDVSSGKPGEFDTVGRWKYTRSLWGGFTKVLANANIKAKYIEALLKTSLEDGVQYLETKKSFNENERLYRLDPDPKYKETLGKNYLENVSGTQEIPLVNSIMKMLQVTHKEMKLIGMKRLVQSVRHLSVERVYEDVQRSIQLHKMYPDMIAGFDLSGEEDTGPSNYYHLDSFLLAVEYSRSTNNSYRLVGHAGETSYSGDVKFRPGEDTETFSGVNVVDLIALNASRLGHGLSIIKHPSLMELVKSRGVAIEICPACNQMLGYVPDLRNHPAITYHRAGIPLVLGSDAHGVLGSEYFTVDWYLAYTAWNLEVRDLKRLAHNSLYYSSLSDVEKVEAIDIWKKAWNKFIDELYHTVCGEDISMAMGVSTKPSAVPTIQISRVAPYRFPRKALDVNTTSHVDINFYGDDFSSLICVKVFCKAGENPEVSVEYKTSQQLVCPLPLVDILSETEDNISFNVTLSTQDPVSGAFFSYKMFVV